MGYILPITHHTYKNYQYRMEKSKESPHHIKGTYKVVFHNVDKDFDFNKKNPPEKRLRTKTRSKEHVYVKQLNENDRVELTGKGGRIDEQV